MSYLSLPRLSFSGRFQADVSTVNNDVRHYSNDFFEPRFQDVTGPATDGKALQNGWWNPSGTGAFRLVGTKVVEAVTGSGQTEAAAVGLDLNAQVERSAAKLVDLDPQMQMVSMIYGMRVVLSQDGTEIMRGDYRPSAFRDICFGRLVGSANSAGASAKFTSVLTGVEWASDMPDLEVLTALRQASKDNGHMLSVNFMTTLFGHFGHFLGLLTGSIGTWADGSPKSFVTGRRFAVATAGNSTTAAGIGAFDAEVSADSKAISLDLSNALPIAKDDGTLQWAGTLQLVVLKTPDEDSAETGLAAGIAQGGHVSDADMVTIGQIDSYDSRDWLQQTAGIVDFAVPEEARALIADHPLALVAGDKVLIRETVGGQMIRADDFVIRLDTLKDAAVKVERPVFATKWGQPAALHFQMSVAPTSGGQGGGPDTRDVAPPQAGIPPIGPPPKDDGPSAVQVAAGGQTGADGRAIVTLHATDPGNPRGYMDGQIYQVNYVLAAPGASPPPMLDAFFLHLRDAYEAPEHPDWQTDLAPFMQQYDNLYPVMSHNLFSLSDPVVAAQHARLLIFAFERPEEDPNHMPATRDLSAGKRQAVVRWLADKVPGAAASSIPQPKASGDAPASGDAAQGRLMRLSDAAIDAALARLDDGTDGKTQAMRAFLLSQKAG